MGNEETESNARVVTINDHVRICRRDPLNLVIERPNPKKPGAWITVGYYSSWPAACEALATRHVHLLVDEHGTLNELQVAIKKLAANLKVKVGDET